MERADPSDPTTIIETVTIDLALATESPAGTFTYSLATVFDDGSILDSSDLILGIKAGDLINVVYQDDLDSQGNEVEVRLDPSGPITILAGVDGVVGLAPLSLPVGDSFTVTVTDADIPTGGGSVVLVVERADPSDPTTVIETVTIPLSDATEGPAGTFTYSLPTIFDDGSAPNSGDLILGIQTGDLLDVVY